MMTGITTDYFWAIAGTIAMMLMFIFASIPMMENKNLASKPGYIDYMKRVPMLFPF
jgi:protein-S-isoprenylcysteine O-methyltransferase Ste14